MGLWPIFLLLGWEQVRIVPGITAVTPLLFVSYPYTHSLVADVVWGVLLGGVYFALRRDANGAFWLFALVDLALGSRLHLAPGGHAACGRAERCTAWASGIPFRRRWSWSSRCSASASCFTPRATRPRDRMGSVLLWIFVIVARRDLPDVGIRAAATECRVLAWSGLLGWLFLAWAYWIDRHRESVH